MDENVHNLPSRKAGKNLDEVTSIRASWRFKDFIFTKSLSRESEEETLWRLIALKEISKEDLKYMPPKYAEKLNKNTKGALEDKDDKNI